MSNVRHSSPNYQFVRPNPSLWVAGWYQALNKKIDEERERQLPKSEEGKNGVSAFANKDYIIAKINFEICSERKEIACINNLGVLYQYGLGVPKDAIRASEYYKSAGDLGSGTAQYNYALTKAQIPNQKLDAFEHLKLQKEAIEKGSANAMGSMAGSMALSNNSLLPQEWKKQVSAGVPKEKLLNYAKAAAMRDSRDGKVALGIYYLYGINVNKNINLAKLYFEQALKQGDLRAAALA